MKVTSIALGAVLLLAAGTHTQAFAPGLTRSSSASSSIQHIPTKSTTAIFTATIDTSVASNLGLQYTPIAPFGKGIPSSDLGSDAKMILGGKGANLAEMSGLGLSVPPGFTITTECCDRYCGDWNKALPLELWESIVASIDGVQDAMQSEFGSPENPLLLSVRSGAAISMPGMVSLCANAVPWPLVLSLSVVHAKFLTTGSFSNFWSCFVIYLRWTPY